MSIDEQDPVVHDLSRVEDRDQVLADALAHADAHEAQFHAPPGDGQAGSRWKSPVALLVLVAAGVLVVFPPTWLAGAPPPSIQVEDLERGLVAAMYLQAMQVEVYRVRNGRLPEDLSELPVAFPELRLVRSDGRVYQILGRRPGGEALVYDSALPEPGFAAAASGWSTGGAP